MVGNEEAINLMPDRKWDLDWLATHLSSNKINPYCLKIAGVGTFWDQLCYGEKKSMPLYNRLPLLQNSNAFNWIWILSIPPRVKFFWWKLHRLRLPYKTVLNQRGILQQMRSLLWLIQTRASKIISCSFATWLMLGQHS